MGSDPIGISDSFFEGALTRDGIHLDFMNILLCSDKHLVSFHL